jgi:hypothetical protein
VRDAREEVRREGAGKKREGKDEEKKETHESKLTNIGSVKFTSDLR